MFYRAFRFRKSYSRLSSWLFNSERKRSRANSASKVSAKRHAKRQESLPTLSISQDSTEIYSLLHDYEHFMENNDHMHDKQKLTVLFLTTESSASENDYLVFAYPNRRENIISKLKGMFLTMTQVVNDVTTELPENAVVSVELSPDCDNPASVKAYQVSFIHEFNGILVVAMPCTIHNDIIPVDEVSNHVAHLITFLYESMASGFRNTVNHRQIQQVLTIMNTNITNDEALSQSIPSISIVPKLIIDDDELSLHMSEMLSEYEAMDWLFEDQNFNISDEINNFLILGSCIYFKSLLISSHLSDFHLSDVNIYLASKGILELSNLESTKLVAWEEVFPSRQSQSASADFVENAGARFYMLTVVVQHTVFVALFEVPFVGFEVKQPNSTIIMQTLKYVAVNLNYSGLMDEIDHQINAQKQYFTNSALKALEGDSKLKLSEKLKTLSLREFFQSSTNLSSVSNVISSKRSTPSLLSVDNRPMTSKSLSSPSLVTQGLHSSVANESTTSSISDFAFNSTLASHNNLESSSACRQTLFASLACQYNYDLRQRFPSNMVMFAYVDTDSRTYCGSLLQVMPNKPIVCDLIAMFRKACIHLKKQLDLIYPTANEYGLHFSMCTSSYALSNTVPLTHSKLKAKKSNEFTNENLFWICCRRESLSRNLYACYRSATNAFDVSMESLCYSIQIRHEN